jgi:hypothetical protein
VGLDQRRIEPQRRQKGLLGISGPVALALDLTGQHPRTRRQEVVVGNPGEVSHSRIDLVTDDRELGSQEQVLWCKRAETAELNQCSIDLRMASRQKIVLRFGPDRVGPIARAPGVSKCPNR